MNKIKNKEIKMKKYILTIITCTMALPLLAFNFNGDKFEIDLNIKTEINDALVGEINTVTRENKEIKDIFNFEFKKCYAVDGFKIIEGVILSDFFCGLGFVKVGLNPERFGDKIICHGEQNFRIDDVFEDYDKAEIKVLNNKIRQQSAQIDFLEDEVKIEKRFLLVNILLLLAVLICSVARLFL